MITHVIMKTEPSYIFQKYSISTELSDTDCCFLLYHEIIAYPKLKQHPNMDFPSTTLLSNQNICTLAPLLLQQ